MQAICLENILTYLQLIINYVPGTEIQTLLLKTYHSKDRWSCKYMIAMVCYLYHYFVEIYMWRLSTVFCP